MRLVDDFDNNLKIESKMGELSLIEMFEIARARDGRAVSRIETDCGLSHGTLARFRSQPTNRGISVRCFLIAMMEMGYEVTLTKQEPRHDRHLY